MNDHRLQVVIPAHNEAGRLPATLDLLRRHAIAGSARLAPRMEAIVVDNACTDDTAALARSASSAELPVAVVRCDRRGKGAAVAAGVAVSDAPYVAYMDADGATSLDALDRAMVSLAAGADVVVASRAHPDSVVSARHLALRGWGASAFRAIAARVVGGISDTQCGFKVMRGELARQAFRDVHSTGFSFDVELLARLRERRAAVVELPVTWTDVAGSTFRPARHGAAAFADLARIYWRTRPASQPLRHLVRVDLVDPLQPQQCFAQLHL